jgi:protein-disulfide isomerase
MTGSVTASMPRSLLALVVILAGAAACKSRTPAAAPASPAAPPSAMDVAAASAADKARIAGSATASVWLIEVSDFQCPYCKAWHDSSYAAIKRDYVDAGRVRLAYVNFPLDIHKNARPAAEAAMCAGAQGHFWQMHDALFETQPYWQRLSDPAPAFDSLAASVDVNVPAMRACIAAGTMKATIEGDIDRAKQQGVQSTPSFIIGGQVIAGAQPLAVMRQALDAVLAGTAGGPRP